MKLNEIYCGDCLDIMKDISNKSIDLVLTDPPYGIRIGGSGRIGGSCPIYNSEIVEPTQYDPVKWDNKPLSKEQFSDYSVARN